MQTLDTVKKTLEIKNLYIDLEPFIASCSKSETLLLFLVKHESEINELADPESLTSLLTKLFPRGLEQVAHIIKRQYKDRGFPSDQLQLEELLSSYEQ